MKITRHYLTCDEINMIVGAIIREEKALSREVIKVGMVLELVCEDANKYKTYNEMYDVYARENINLDIEVNNYYLINRCVEEEMGTTKAITMFIEALQQKVDTLDADYLIKQISDLKDMIK